MKKLLPILLFFAGAAFSQEVIQQQDFLNIFGSATGFHYYTPRVNGNIDIGNTGGPNLYDFSDLSLTGPLVSNNYDVSTIPILAARYPAAGFTFGESPTTIEKNPVFVIVSGILYSVGDATTLSPTLKFTHYSPPMVWIAFPTSYGATGQQVTDHYDSTFNSSGQLLSADHLVSTEANAIDGYGTLRVGGHDYQCIRARTEHVYDGGQNNTKEFLYFTREGVLVMVGGVPVTAPNSGTVAAGIQAFLAPSVVGVRHLETRPREFALNQNFPNHFNPVTTITYQLPSEGRVTLKVYNIMGCEVATLVNAVEQPGYK